MWRKSEPGKRIDKQSPVSVSNGTIQINVHVVKSVGQDWTGLTVPFSSHAPTGTWTFVQPNKYETGRASIAIYNWDLSATVSVDVTGAIAPGTRYQVLDAQNYFGAPVAAGTYDGAPISIPMAGLTIATPNGSVPTQPMRTAPQFGAFVLIPLQ